MASHNGSVPDDMMGVFYKPPNKPDVRYMGAMVTRGKNGHVDIKILRESIKNLMMSLERSVLMLDGHYDREYEEIMQEMKEV